MSLNCHLSWRFEHHCNSWADCVFYQFVYVLCVGADGLDSAGCSPKDDEDDSDNEIPENCGAAAMKSNKISPASSYHAGSSYYYPMSKQKSWLARCDNQRHVAGNDSSYVEPSEDSYYSQYQRQRLDDSTSAARGFGANGDVKVQRLKQRKQARRERESAGLTTADSVAGYRGRDCSIDELIEYIDAKPPAGSKTQKQTNRRKKRKKRNSSNRSTNSANDTVESIIPVGRSDKCTDVGSGEMSPSKLFDQTAAAAAAAAAGGHAATTDECKTHSSSGDDKVNTASISELSLHRDTLTRMPPSGVFNSNLSDGDKNGSDFHRDSNCRNTDQGHGVFQEIEVVSVVDSSNLSNVDSDPTAKLGSEHSSLTGVSATVTEGSESASHINWEESRIVVLDSCCLQLSNVSVSDDEKALSNEHTEDSKVAEEDNDVQQDKALAVNNENSSRCVVSSYAAVSDAVVDSLSDVHVLQRRQSEDLGCMSSVRQPGELSGISQKICSIDAGQSTPSSSISDARDSIDFDSQSLADDLSSDFDFTAQAASNENEFTVVTQKKKKKLVRHNVGSVDCFQRTFCIRTRQQSRAVQAHETQSSYKHESLIKELSTVSSSIPQTCPSHSNNDLSSETVAQQTSTPVEVPRIAAEIVQSLSNDRQMKSVTHSISSVAYLNNNVTNAVLNCAAVNDGVSTSQLPTSLVTVSTSHNAKDLRRPNAEHRAQEKVFLDTRQPHAGVSPANAFSELSFWYDTNVQENQSMQLQTDTHRLAAIRNTGGEPALNEVSDSVSFSTALLVTSSCTVNASDSRTESAVSTRSAASDDLSLLRNLSLLQSKKQSVTVRDETRRQPAISNCPVTMTSVSSSSQYMENVSNSHSDNLTVSAAVIQSPAVISASITASSQHSATRGRQPFFLGDAQLFLYNGQLMLIAAATF